MHHRFSPLPVSDTWSACHETCVKEGRKEKGEKPDKRKHVWVVYDLESHDSQIFDFPVEGQGLLIYGSITRDLAGRFYVAGQRNNKPMLIQIDPRG